MCMPYTHVGRGDVIPLIFKFGAINGVSGENHNQAAVSLGKNHL